MSTEIILVDKEKDNVLYLTFRKEAVRYWKMSDQYYRNGLEILKKSGDEQKNRRTFHEI